MVEYEDYTRGLEHLVKPLRDIKLSNEFKKGLGDVIKSGEWRDYIDLKGCGDRREDLENYSLDLPMGQDNEEIKNHLGSCNRCNLYYELSKNDFNEFLKYRDGKEGENLSEEDKNKAYKKFLDQINNEDKDVEE